MKQVIPKRSSRPYTGSIKSRNFSQGTGTDLGGRRISGNNPLDYNTYLAQNTNLNQNVRYK